MKTRRGLAFIFDMMIVLLVTVMLSNISFLNPDSLKVSDDFAYTYTEQYSSDILELAFEMRINPDYNKVKEFVNDNADNYYKLSKNNLFGCIYYLIVTILYFGVFEHFTGGQSVGKKFFKIRVVNDDDTIPSIKKLSLRSLLSGMSIFLGINGILFIKIILLLILSAKAFMYTEFVLIFISFIIEISLLVTMLVRKDGKSLNDLLFKTKIIDLN